MTHEKPQSPSEFADTLMGVIEPYLGDPTICLCGLARSYHEPDQPVLADHAWVPRYSHGRPFYYECTVPGCALDGHHRAASKAYERVSLDPETMSRTVVAPTVFAEMAATAGDPVRVAAQSAPPTRLRRVLRSVLIAIRKP